MLENILAAKMLEKSAKKYPGKYSKLMENEFSSNFSCLKKTLFASAFRPRLPWAAQKVSAESAQKIRQKFLFRVC